ncbi:MAG: hypothetical protein OXC41_00715 [Gammaproteobacteria bacterium]|nr:hypothetical protein [Gammaproteobacteria bacterium]
MGLEVLVGCTLVRTPALHEAPSLSRPYRQALLDWCPAGFIRDVVPYWGSMVPGIVPVRQFLFLTCRDYALAGTAGPGNCTAQKRNQEPTNEELGQKW